MGLDHLELLRVVWHEVRGELGRRRLDKDEIIMTFWYLRHRKIKEELLGMFI